MPTNQKRHTCYKCGRKRVEKYMKKLLNDPFRKKNYWYCNTNKGIFCLKEKDTPGIKKINLY